MARRKRKKLGAHLSNSGLYTNGNWPEYRYGPKKPISLAGSTARAIFKGQKRDHVVDEVMNVLRTRTLSPFQHEAACRHGLRKALCLDGYAWTRSDEEAALIVHEGLSLLGASRPSYAEGQREYSISTDYCVGCHGPIDEENIAKGHRFCSADCARNTYERRAMGEVRKFYDVAQNAYRIIRTDAASEMICEECHRPFKRSKIKTEQKYGRGRFCSIECHNASMRIYQDTECEACGTVFQPSRKGQKFCSRTCVYASQSKGPNRTCQQCGAGFRYHREKSDPNGGLFCSKVCSDAGKWADKCFEKTCEWCGSVYAAKNPKSRCCSAYCSLQTSKVRTGKLKKMTPQVFDYVTRVAA
jgi:hypothetical protein